MLYIMYIMSHLCNLCKNHVAELPVKVSVLQVDTPELHDCWCSWCFWMPSDRVAEDSFQKKISIFVQGMPCMLKWFPFVPGKLCNPVQNVPFLWTWAYSQHNLSMVTLWGQSGWQAAIPCVNLRHTAELRLEKIDAMAWMLLLGVKGRPSAIAKLRFQ